MTRWGILARKIAGGPGTERVKTAPRGTAGRRYAAAVAAATIAAALVCTFGVSAQAQVPPSLTISPTGGPAGTVVTLTPANFPAGVACNSLTYVLVAGSTVTLGTGSPAAPFSATIPNLTPGDPSAHTYPIQATCQAIRGLSFTATTRFTVSGAPPPVTTPPTTAPPATTPTPGGLEPNTPGGTPGATTTTTGPGGDTPDTTPAPDDPTTPPPTELAAGPVSTSYLALDQAAIAPGGAVTATGRGCPGGARVDLAIGSTDIGRTVAGPDGSFEAPLHLSDVAVGRHDVEAHCGPVLTAPLDVVLASHVEAGASTTVAIILFFVLIGLFACRRVLFPKAPAPRPVRVELPPPPDREEST